MPGATGLYQSTPLSKDVYKYKPINKGTVLILLSFGYKRSWYNYAVIGNNNIYLFLAIYLSLEQVGSIFLSPEVLKFKKMEKS